MEVSISNKAFTDGVWEVNVSIVSTSGSRSGPHTVPLPEDATNEQLIEAIRAMYN